MNNENIILHNITPDELKQMLSQLVDEKLEEVNIEMQRVIGEDDLVSSGTATRLLGMCGKGFRHLLQEGHFTVYYHMKEKRFSRGELLEYRNKYRVPRKASD